MARSHREREWHGGASAPHPARGLPERIVARLQSELPRARDDATLHDLVFEQHQRPPRPSFGRRGTGQGDQFRLGLAIEDTSASGVRGMMTSQGTVQPSLDQTLTRSGDRIDTRLQGDGDLAVTLSLAGVRGVGFQQNARFQ